MNEDTGKKYCPSNGTEGMIFVSKFCEQCIHEKFMHTQNENDKKCDIFSRTLIHDVTDKEYPLEWQYDENGNPTCTSFVKWDWGSEDDEDGLNEPPPDIPDDPNQLVLPFILDEIKEDTIVINPKCGGVLHHTN